MHEYLDPTSEYNQEYWDFSFDNMADDVVANLKEMYPVALPALGGTAGGLSAKGDLQLVGRAARELLLEMGQKKALFSTGNMGRVWLQTLDRWENQRGGCRPFQIVQLLC